MWPYSVRVAEGPPGEQCSVLCRVPCCLLCLVSHVNFQSSTFTCIMCLPVEHAGRDICHCSHAPHVFPRIALGLSGALPG